MEAKIVREYIRPVSLDLQRIADTLRGWSRNYATRRELRELDAHQLNDIGVDRIAAKRESEKPFWQD